MPGPQRHSEICEITDDAFSVLQWARWSSVVHVSLEKGLTGAEWGSRWLSVSLQPVSEPRLKPAS